MIATSSEYQAAVISKTQRWIPSATVDFSDFNIDNSIQATVQNPTHTSDGDQLADGMELATYRWAYWDSFQWGDHFRSKEPSSNEKGAVSFQKSDDDGNFNESFGAIFGDYFPFGEYAPISDITTYPSFTLTFSPRAVNSIKAVFEGVLQQWGVDFDVLLVQSDGTVITYNIVGNSTYRYTSQITTVLQVVQYTVVVYSWSKANANAKMMETFTSIQKAYSNNEIISFSMLEETEAKQSSSPIGNVTANSLNISFLNRNSEFDNDNLSSILAGNVVENRRVKPFLKINGADDLIPIGEFYTKSWTVNNNDQIASAVCQDLISLMDSIEYKNSQFIEPEAPQNFTYTTTAEFDTFTRTNIDTAGDSMSPGDSDIYLETPEPGLVFGEYAVFGEYSVYDWASLSATASKQISFNYQPGTNVDVTISVNSTVPVDASIKYYIDGNEVDGETGWSFVPTTNDTTQQIGLMIIFAYAGTKPILNDITVTVSAKVSLMALAHKILNDYDDLTDLLQGRWTIAQSYADYEIPVAYFPIVSYRDALKMIAEANAGRIYQNREGYIIVEAESMMTAPVKTYTNSTIFNEKKQINPHAIFNRATVVVNEHTHDASEEIASVSIDIANGEEQIVEIKFNVDVADTITYSTLPTDVTITNADEYTWGVILTIENTSGGDESFTLTVSGRPWRVRGAKKKTIDDTDSIRKAGIIEFVLDNQFVQSEDFAESLANRLIDSYGNQRRTMQIDALPEPALLIGETINSNGYDYIVQSNEIEIKAGELNHIISGVK